MVAAIIPVHRAIGYGDFEGPGPTTSASTWKDRQTNSDIGHAAIVLQACGREPGRARSDMSESRATLERWRYRSARRARACVPPARARACPRQRRMYRASGRRPSSAGLSPPDAATRARGLGAAHTSATGSSVDTTRNSRRHPSARRWCRTTRLGPRRPGRSGRASSTPERPPLKTAPPWRRRSLPVVDRPRSEVGRPRKEPRARGRRARFMRLSRHDAVGRRRTPRGHTGGWRLAALLRTTTWPPSTAGGQSRGSWLLIHYPNPRDFPANAGNHRGR